jgi:hypothetical protein
MPTGFFIVEFRPLYLEDVLPIASEEAHRRAPVSRLLYPAPVIR